MFLNPIQRRLHVGAPSKSFNPLRRRSWTEWYFWASLFFYAAICVVVYFAYVAPWIAGDVNTRIGADSDRYWEFVEEAHSPAGTPILSATGNFLGPVSIGLLLHSGFAVMCFNFLLLIIAIKVGASIPDVKVGTFGILLLLNAELLPSLTTLNKEILALISSVLIAKYLYAKNPSRMALLGVLSFSVFARWEEAAILILYLLLRATFRRCPKIALIFLIALITVAFPITLRILGLDLSTFDWLMQGANTILVLNKIQYAFGFPLVVFPKILMTMAGSWLSPAFYTANPGIIGGFNDPQQEIFQPLGCIAMMIVFTYAVWTKRMKLANPIAMFVAITLVVTAATPFIQPRYLYGVYVMLCIELSRPKHLYGVTQSTPQRTLEFILGNRNNSRGAIPLDT